MITTILPIEQQLLQWEEASLITALDRHFALEMADIHNEPSPLFILICAMLSQKLSNQHPCLSLSMLDLDNPLLERTPSVKITATTAQLQQKLMTFSAIGTKDDNKPLILDGDRLYLKRYYDYECHVANHIKTMTQTHFVNDSTITAMLDTLFPTMDNKVNWQKVATLTALSQQFSVITGGPGTGKTTTITKLLLVLCLTKQMIIRLAAPTGKAAARLTESIKASKSKLATELADSALDLTCIDQIPETAITLHRLLGVLPNSHQFRHNKNNPLPLDLLIIDEASMVDLPMMAKLIAALPANARLILLGDQDQLASVEAGAVLADICAGLRKNQQWRVRYSPDFAQYLSDLTQFDLNQYAVSNVGIGNSLCMLHHSHRFQGDAGIGMLAKAVNNSDISAIKTVWRQDYPELNWIEQDPNKQGLTQLLMLAQQHYGNYLKMLNQPNVEPAAIIEQYNQFRVLCATRVGEFGVEGINQHITQSLKIAGLINPELEFYHGRPLIIQHNDYNLGLFNGDIGIILYCPIQQRLMAHFTQDDGNILKVLPARLPSHESCYAMTVHKSQGSEFNTVALVLPVNPSPAQSQILTKELIYTAITRAKKHFSCLSYQRVFNNACRKQTQRVSGLSNRLWGEKASS